MTRGTRKAVQGQLGLLGDVVGYKLRYQPHKVVSSTGEAIVVVRIPPDADTMDKTAALEAAAKLARGVKTAPNKYFYLKRPRRT